MVDEEGYRPNVGIILCNDRGQVFWGQRRGRSGWQFPQGGIQAGETPEQAMYRELEEEIGLRPEHVEIVGRTEGWLYYELPEQYRRSQDPSRQIKGQKQVWFLLHLVGCDDDVCLTAHEQPEFESWSWVEYWHPLDEVIDFKKKVYEAAMNELQGFLSQRETGC